MVISQYLGFHSLDQRIPLISSLNPCYFHHFILWHQFSFCGTSCPMTLGENQPYTLGEIIGRGRTAIVRRATRSDGSFDFAVKIVPKSSLQSAPSLAQFSRELRAMAQCDSPFVLRLIDLFEDSSDFCLVVDLCAGGDLFHHLQKNTYLSEQESKVLFRQLLEGLNTLHASGFAHRDIKPENILLDGNGRVKIGDLGMAADLGDAAQACERCGTSGYAPPHLGENVDLRKSDIWSCGVVLFQMISGRMPWGRAGPVPGLSEDVGVPMTVSLTCARFIRRILQMDPSSRPSIDDLLGDAWLAGVDTPPVAPTAWAESVDSDKITGILGRFAAGLPAAAIASAPVPKVLTPVWQANQKPPQRNKTVRSRVPLSELAAPFAPRTM
jgi:serine/threonine protein kinase